MIRSITTALLLAVAISCSKDTPAPVAPPAGKAAEDDLGSLFDVFNSSQPPAEVDTTIARPAGLSVVEIASSFAVIRWDNVEGVWGYDVSYRDDSEEWNLHERVRFTRMDLGYAYELTLEGLDHSTEYQWAVRARDTWDGDSISQWSFGPRFTTMDSSSMLYPPQNLQVKTVGEDWVALSWDAVEDATSYEVRFDADKGSYDAVYGGWEYYEWCNVSVGDKTSITASVIDDCENHEIGYGLKIRSATSYHWSVRAKNEQTVSSWADRITFITSEIPEFTDHVPSDVVIYDPDRFNITLIFLDKFHPIVEQMIKEGAESWERVIIGDLPDKTITHDRQEYNVDDVILFIENNFDGTYDGNLSWGGVSRTRSDIPSLKHTTVVGEIAIDSHLDEVLRRIGYKQWSKYLLEARMNDLNKARLLVVHEIAHTLGLARARSVLDDDGKCYWDGPIANALFGGRIPLEPGCGHWADEYFPNGVVSSLGLGRRDLYGTDQVYDFVTDIEVAAIEDLGYTVDYTYAVPSITYPSGRPSSEE